jgi:hypothetical protein
MAKMQEYQELIKDRLPRHDGEVLKAILEMSDLIKDHVYGTIFLMAAAVEMIEPSEEFKRLSQSKEEGK